MVNKDQVLEVPITQDELRTLANLATEKWKLSKRRPQFQIDDAVAYELGVYGVAKRLFGMSLADARYWLSRSIPQQKVDLPPTNIVVHTEHIEVARKISSYQLQRAEDPSLLYILALSAMDYGNWEGMVYLVGWVTGVKCGAIGVDGLYPITPITWEWQFGPFPPFKGDRKE